MKISKEEALKVFSKESYDVIDYFALPMKWHDPFNKDEFHIANSYVADKYHTFYRFNEEEIAHVRGASGDVAYLATHSSGIQLQFITDSRFIRVRCKNLDSFSMKNMAFPGMCGFDLYYFEPKFNKWMFNRSTVFTNFIDDKKYIAEVGVFQDKKERKMILNFPLYNGVLDLAIELEDGCVIKPWSYTEKKKIVIYGTSIMQSCASSRPGLATSNTLSRHFSQEVVNYGFSGAANLEKEVAEIIASRDDVEMFIVDCEANAGMSMNMYNNIEKFFEVWYSKHPNEPVIIMNRIPSQYDGSFPNTIEGHKMCDEIMKEIVEKYKAEGKNIRFVDNFALFREDESEYTIEGLHPTDEGMRVITNAYIKAISEVKAGK